MAKRNASSDLNRDNWNEEDDENEEAGTFTPVSGSQLQNRIIKKAKRTSNSSSESLQGASPFAKFAGFSSAASGSSPFSFLKKSSGDATSNNMFSSGLKKVEEAANGNSTGNPEKNTEKLSIKSEANVSPAFESSNTTVPKEEARNLEYYRQLQSLNESVLKWMQLHLSKNSCSDFTPVFNDYKKHLDTLNVTYPVRKKENPELKNSHEFKHPSPKDEFSRLKNTSQVSNSSVLQKENNGKKEDETDYGANFKSNTTNTSTFSFGIKLTPTATSSISPAGPTSSSKEAAEEQTSTSDFFSFFNKSRTDKPFTFAATPAVNTSESGQNEDQEYVPPKNEISPIQEKDALYSKKCKLFFKKGEEFIEKGIGFLHLKPLDGKTQLLIRADTITGTILLNIILKTTVPTSKAGKNSVSLWCVPNPPLETDSNKPIQTIIRVKTSEDADELLDNLNKHKS